jgi:hypothetical protein
MKVIIGTIALLLLSLGGTAGAESNNRFDGTYPPMCSPKGGCPKVILRSDSVAGVGYSYLDGTYPPMCSPNGGCPPQ